MIYDLIELINFTYSETESRTANFVTKEIIDAEPKSELNM